MPSSAATVATGCRHTAVDPAFSRADVGADAVHALSVLTERAEQRHPGSKFASNVGVIQIRRHRDDGITLVDAFKDTLQC